MLLWMMKIKVIHLGPCMSCVLSFSIHVLIKIFKLHLSGDEKLMKKFIHTSL